MILRSLYVRTPRGGSAQWLKGNAGAVLRDEFFGVAPGGTTYYQAVGASLTATSALARFGTQWLAASLAGIAGSVRRQVAGVYAAGLALEAALQQTNIVTLLPDGTASNTGWTAVGASSLWGALATGDSDYITSSTSGSVAEVTLSNPASGLSLSARTLTVRVQLG